ncbi:MAG: fatty acid desaturase [Kofleriaceae bacterium]
MADQFLASAPLFPLSKYVRELRPDLGPEVYQPATSRVALIPIHLTVIAGLTLVIAKAWVPWPIVPVLAIVIGISFACLTFVAHEALHGGIVRGKLARHVVGWIGFLPFVVSPRLWVAWHDRVHHANANMPDDPDMYPSLDVYHANRQVRAFVNWFSLGGRRWRGVLSLVLGFTVQSAHQLIRSTTVGFLTRDKRRLAIVETLLGVVVWGTVAALVGFVPFLFVYVMPLVIANMIIMSFILTNHGLNPRVSVNDPLVSGLSVTTPRWIETLTLGFGFHVEHHLFPAMSTRHAPAVRALVLKRWPERYQSMSIVAAVRALHRTGRIYKDAVTLVDPRSGAEFPVLMPRMVEPVAIPAVCTAVGT